MKDILIFILCFVTIFLFGVLAPLGMVISLILKFKKFAQYSFDSCIGIDQLGNIMMAPLFNIILIKKEGHKFGCPDETISSVLGKNELTETLTKLGIFLSKCLSKI